MSDLHWYYTFCTGVTHFLHSFLSQSESSNFFMYVIMQITILHTKRQLRKGDLLSVTKLHQEKLKKELKLWQRNY